MSKPAAFQAAFSDFKLVKTRGQAQFIFEVPVDGADAALDALGGLPRAANEVWVGIARLDLPKAVSEPPKPANEPKERRRFKDLPLPQQAGIVCEEPAFWKYLSEEARHPTLNAQDAAYFVRRGCHVKSRSDIREGDASGGLWIDLRDRYHAWKLAAEHVE